MEDDLADLSKDPTNGQIQARLEGANQFPQERGENNKRYVDVKQFSELFQRRKVLSEDLALNGQEDTYKAGLNELADTFASFVNEHEYPSRWEELLKFVEASHTVEAQASSDVQAEGSGNMQSKDPKDMQPKSAQAKGPSDMQAEGTKTSSKINVRPGFTLRNQPILGCRKFMGGYRFYVEITDGNIKTCLAQTGDEVGGSASRAYLDWAQCVVVGDDARKYRKKDGSKFGEIKHVACKPAHIRTIPKDPNRQSRRPLIDVYATFDSKDVWMTYSDLVSMLGKGEALFLIE